MIRPTYVHFTIKLEGRIILKDPKKWAPLFGVNGIIFVL